MSEFTLISMLSKLIFFRKILTRFFFIFFQKSGKCIPKSWVCDADPDCGVGDTSDEGAHCVYPTCQPFEYTCDSSKRCIRLDYLVGPNVKNPLKIIYSLKSWYWSIILISTTVWQILNMKRTQMTGNRNCVDWHKLARKNLLFHSMWTYFWRVFWHLKP